jgi:hypothetical protein
VQSALAESDATGGKQRMDGAGVEGVCVFASTNQTAVARVAPVAHAHVNSLGRYDLHRQPPPTGHLRPLRRADEHSEGVLPSPPLGVSGDKY